MVGFLRFAIVGIMVAGSAAAYCVVDRYTCTERTDQPYIEPTDPESPHQPTAESLQQPPTLAATLSDIRNAELSRRAQRPVTRDKGKRDYDSILNGRKFDGTFQRARPAKPMPPTFCLSVEPAPRYSDDLSGPHRVHDLAFALFVNQSGFGLIRMGVFKNNRGDYAASPTYDRVELVSLLTDNEPSVYVIDEMATPALARQATRRPLDEFERLGLDAVRRGEELVWTREAPKRMFGAIRAREDCLECHQHAKVGDLLGAFTYYLNRPVDQIKDEDWRALRDDEPTTYETAFGWEKHPENPLIGSNLGTCSDISVLKEGDTFRRWFSWRSKKSIALSESKDGVRWSKPAIVLGTNNKTDWETDVNRPVVIKQGDRYQMWYTGQAQGKSWIGYATSRDGLTWDRMSDKPVLSADQPWEKAAVMCPHVLYDDKTKLYRMWYSGGEQDESDGIGYATSGDGLTWTKHPNNPIFKSDETGWENERVTACQVVRQGDWHHMFYIGFSDANHAAIGLARSRDGVTGWERHRANPIIRPGKKDQWDHDAIYKPYAIFDGKRWMLWYNGRKDGVEQIGLAVHEGEDLDF